MAKRANRRRQIQELWPAVVDHVRDSGGEILSTILEGARPLRIGGERGSLYIGFPPGANFAKRKAESKACAEQLTDSIEAIAGARLHLKFELMEEAPEAGEPDAAASSMGDDEIIELLKTKFDAREIVEDEKPDEGAQSREAG